MIFYIISIVGGDALIILINYLLNKSTQDYSSAYIIISGILSAIIIIAIDGLTSAICRRCLPEKWFDYKTKIHTASKKECKVYEVLGIKYWKDHILELGMFTNFSKREVADPSNIEYIRRFILECNYGTACHLVNVIFGFAVCFIFPLSITVPASLINAFLSILPLMTLRYNSNRLGRMEELLAKKEARKNQKQEEN